MATAAPVDETLAMAPGPVPLADWLVVVPIALPLLAAGVALLLSGRGRAQVNVAVASLALLALSNLVLLANVAGGGPVVMTMGGWLPPFGISVTVDLLSAVLLFTTSLVALAGALFAIVDIDEERQRHGFYCFYLLLIAGVGGAFSTGDVFNLYVWFEVFLIASFGLIVLGGEPAQLDGAVKYGVLNFLATTFFLVAIALLYGLVGTLNIADLARTVDTLPVTAPMVGVAALFVLAFAMKAAAFPVQAWLPASYHVPRITVAAIFGGLLTKVGIYGLLRIVVMVMPAAAAGLSGLMAWIAGLTAVLAVLCAVAESNVRRMLGFIVVSSIGLMLVGIALGTHAALSGAIVYAVHSIIATTAIYLAVGMIERAGGAGDLSAGAGVFRERALLAGLFLVFAFALAGLPPFSGVWPKVMLIEASLAAGSPWLAAAVIVTGLLTTLALGRVWVLVVLRDRPGRAGARVGEGAAASAARRAREMPAMVALAGLAAAVVAIGLYPDPLVRAAEASAAGLLDPAAYVDAVLGTEARP